MKQLDRDVAELLDLVHAAATSKSCREPVALDVRELTVLADVLYICHGDSVRAVGAIADAVLQALEKAKRRATHVEGLTEQQWVLIDLGDVMVHVFLKERREFYGLERLWHDARQVDLPEA